MILLSASGLEEKNRLNATTPRANSWAWKKHAIVRVQWTPFTCSRANSQAWGLCEQLLPRACKQRLTGPGIKVIKVTFFLRWSFFDVISPVWSSLLRPFLNRSPSQQFYQTALHPSLWVKTRIRLRPKNLLLFSSENATFVSRSLLLYLSFICSRLRVDPIFASELNNNIFEMEEKKII